MCTEEFLKMKLNLRFPKAQSLNNDLKKDLLVPDVCSSLNSEVNSILKIELYL